MPRPRLSPSARAAKPIEAAPRRKPGQLVVRRRPESQAERTARAQFILAELHRLYPEANCALRHENALQLLVATILSAQCTDTRVNIVTERLFPRYPTARHFADANPADLEREIQSTGFFRNKARNLIGMGRVLVSQFNGRVPDAMNDLLTLPGVARKTANVVLGTWFNRNEGVVVDTHIGRLATRLCLTWTSRNQKDAIRIERDLMQVLPQDQWTYTGHALIHHGRQVCLARKPKCKTCALSPWCPSRLE